MCSDWNCIKLNLDYPDELDKQTKELHCTILNPLYIIDPEFFVINVKLQKQPAPHCN